MSLLRSHFSKNMGMYFARSTTNFTGGVGLTCTWYDAASLDGGSGGSYVSGNTYVTLPAGSWTILYQSSGSFGLTGTGKEVEYELKADNVVIPDQINSVATSRLWLTTGITGTYTWVRTGIARATFLASTAVSLHVKSINGNAAINYLIEGGTTMMLCIKES